MRKAYSSAVEFNVGSSDVKRESEIRRWTISRGGGGEQAAEVEKGMIMLLREIIV